MKRMMVIGKAYQTLTGEKYVQDEFVEIFGQNDDSQLMISSFNFGKIATVLKINSMFLSSGANEACVHEP